MIALEAAGKTTILYKLNLGEITIFNPPPGIPRHDIVKHKNITIRSWDLIYSSKKCPFYRYYYENCHGLIYVLDSTDQDKMP